MGALDRRAFAALAMLVSPLSANAFCPDWPDVAAEFQRSELVFVGTVVGESEVHRDGDFYDGINYVIDVGEVLKGAPSRPFVVFSENSSGRFPMEAGSTYLVFTSVQSGLLADAPVHTISNCGNSGAVEERKAQLVEVRRLAKAVKRRS